MGPRTTNQERRTKDMKRKLLVIQVAALGYDFLKKNGGISLCGIDFRSTDSVFPTVTSSVQGSFRTASMPSTHGMVANGYMNRNLRRVFFWDQSASQISGNRIWTDFRKNGGKVAMLFWQQSLGESVDMILSPAPIHKHHGGMIQDCYSKPAGLYAEICRKIGRSFNLHHYWGPTASAKSSLWIAQATCAVLDNNTVAPDLCMTYLPGLDYDLQRYGPNSSQASKTYLSVAEQLEMICSVARKNGYEVLIFGDYAIAECNHPVYLNRVLAESGFLQYRMINGRMYADLYASRAFAVVDHEIAHIYVPNSSDVLHVHDILQDIDGVSFVSDSKKQEALGVAHSNSGELVALAEPASWFDYKWWNSRREAPEYAGHVDIHNKPGFDPCELFFGWPLGSVSMNSEKIRGSHGLLGPDRKVAWGSTCFSDDESSLIEIARRVGEWGA